MGLTEQVATAPRDRTAEASRRWPRLPAVSQTTMRRLAVASLVANVALVVTGGAVRLTGSGLGCPTWPRCTAQSFTAHEALGVNGFIEFGNRMLTFVLAAVAVATWLAAIRMRPARSSLRWLSGLLLLAIPLQAVIGGVSVLTDLNPWVVSLHLVASLAIIGVAVVLIRRVDEGDAAPRRTVPTPVALLARVLYAVMWGVLYVGTVVTGSGPHAGSKDAPRNGLSPAAMSQLHADLVFLLVGLTVGVAFTLRATGAPARARRAAGWLLGLELAQGVVGFAQYFTGLPIVLVGVHMLGAALISACGAWLLVSTRERPAAAASSAPAAAAAAAAPSANCGKVQVDTPMRG